jgi:putative hydrolase of the HAD superfamily
MGRAESSGSEVQRLLEYRWLSFDVVGTLIDFERGILDCLDEIATAEGVPFDEEDALARFAAAEEQQQRLTPELPFTQMLAPIYHRLAGELGLPGTDEHSAALRESIRRWPAFADAPGVLAELARRYRLVALTNADNWALTQMAATLGDPFDDSVTAEDVGVNKPDPRVFEHCAERQHVQGYLREDWLHVAQSQYHDIATANRLGVATCWIERRAGKSGFGATPEPEETSVPDYHYSSLADLWNAVERP